MDKASDFELEDCGFDPHHGLLFLIHSSLEHIVTAQMRPMVSHGPLESMVRTVLTVFRKHLRTYIVYLQRQDYISPCGTMDKASDFESEDCGFDPHHGRLFLIHSSLVHIVSAQLRRMLNHGPLESMVCTVLTVFRKHLGTYIVYLQ